MKEFTMMRACECPLEKIQLPVYVSYKMDGIRSAMKDSVALSRNLKPIRNLFIQNYLSNWVIDGTDGELVVGTSFQESTSGIMSAEGEPDFTYYVFDLWDRPNIPYNARLSSLQRRVGRLSLDRVKVLDQILCTSIPEILEFEKHALESGYEGIMIRRHDAPYKYGDSTEREQYLVKRKPFVDEECVIIGFEEQLQNTNGVIGDRSGHIARMVGKGTLGKFLVTSEKWGDFAIGTGQGLTKELRQEIWNAQDTFLGKLIKFKYQNFGIKDKPRLPIFLGFRDISDMP